MKKPSFLQFFVTIFITLFSFAAQAQNIITANGNNTADTSNHFVYTQPSQWINWYKTGDVQAGITPISGCDAACLKKRSIAGAKQVRERTLANVLVASNNHSQGLVAGPITKKEYATALSNFESSLFISGVQFTDSFTEMALVQYSTDSFGYTYIKHGPGFRTCAISKQKGNDYPSGDMGCGQTFGKDAVLAIVNGRAHIVTAPAPAPVAPVTANNGNVGTVGGNGNISIPTAQAGSVNLYIIAGNGNGNPVVNATGGAGGQGGSVGNTTSTAGATPSGNGGGNGNGNGGANSGNNPFGNFIPGGGGNSTTTPPGGGAATTSTTTSSSTGPDYTKPLNGIAAGTKATGAGSIMSGLSDVSREVRQWGSIFGAWGNSGGAMIAGGGFQGNPDH